MMETIVWLWLVLATFVGHLVLACFVGQMVAKFLGWLVLPPILRLVWPHALKDEYRKWWWQR